MYRVATAAGLYDDQWLVIRRADNRIVHSDPRPFAAARWVNVWGSTLGVNKPGKPLSPRFPSPPQRATID